MNSFNWEVGNWLDLRNGGKALVLDLGVSEAVCAVYSKESKYLGITRHFMKTGSCVTSFRTWDVVLPKPDERVVWVNVYRNCDGTLAAGFIYDTKPAAEEVRTGGASVVGCNRIVIRAEFDDDPDATNAN